MQTSEVFKCGQCGESFENEHTAHKHEEGCIHLEVGDTVKFEWCLLLCQGRIINIVRPSKLGDESIVYIEADKEIYDPDPTQCLDGRTVFVTREFVIENLSRKR